MACFKSKFFKYSFKFIVNFFIDLFHIFSSETEGNCSLGGAPRWNRGEGVKPPPPLCGPPPHWGGIPY